MISPLLTADGFRGLSWAMRYLIPALILATPLWADCPALPDRSDELAALFNEAQQAPDEQTGRAVALKMWDIWDDAPDAYAQDLLGEGMSRRASFDFVGANKAFDALVAYCPDYAEGYNQRAFVAFLRQDFPTALDDLDRALARNPLHVAALAGKALTLIGMGRDEDGQDVLRRALQLNPWLSERSLLKDRPEDTF